MGGGGGVLGGGAVWGGVSWRVWEGGGSAGGCGGRFGRGGGVPKVGGGGLPATHYYLCNHRRSPLKVLGLHRSRGRAVNAGPSLRNKRLLYSASSC